MCACSVPRGCHTVRLNRLVALTFFRWCRWGASLFRTHDATDHVVPVGVMLAAQVRQLRCTEEAPADPFGGEPSDACRAKRYQRGGQLPIRSLRRRSGPAGAPRIGPCRFPPTAAAPGASQAGPEQRQGGGAVPARPSPPALVDRGCVFKSDRLPTLRMKVSTDRFERLTGSDGPVIARRQRPVRAGPRQARAAPPPKANR
jgi:hypothetical protein